MSQVFFFIQIKLCFLIVNKAIYSNNAIYLVLNESYNNIYAF